MKIFYIIAFLLAADGISEAQTNIHAVPQPERSQTVITSTAVFFNNIARQIIYSGQVRVDDPQMKMTCEQLTAVFPQAGGHIDHLVARTNVVMDSTDEKGQTTHATSDTATYDYHVLNGVTNEVITLIGHARAENEKIILYGEPITYDRANGSLSAINPRTIIKQNPVNALVNTNTGAAKTNLAPISTTPGLHEPANSHSIKTNFTPAIIQSTNSPASTNVSSGKVQNVYLKAPRNS